MQKVSSSSSKSLHFVSRWRHLVGNWVITTIRASVSTQIFNVQPFLTIQWRLKLNVFILRDHCRNMISISKLKWETEGFKRGVDARDVQSPHWVLCCDVSSAPPYWGGQRWKKWTGVSGKESHCKVLHVLTFFNSLRVNLFCLKLLII